MNSCPCERNTTYVVTIFKRLYNWLIWRIMKESMPIRINVNVKIHICAQYILHNWYFTRRNFREINFREFREWGSHSRKFISQNFSKMAIRESLSREIFPKFCQLFCLFVFFTKKNNDGKRCFLYWHLLK